MNRRYLLGVKGEYLSRVLRFAFRGFAIRTDVWYALISIAVSALTGGAEKPVTEITTHDVARYFLLAIAIYGLIRLVVAPYFIWKEDQERLAALTDEVNRPSRKEEEAGLEHRIALRRELGEEMAKMIAIAEYATVPESFALLYGGRVEEMTRNKIRVRELISLLSYDVALRVTTLNLQSLCERIINAAAAGEDTKPLLKRLWAQRKLTFRLIHRDDEVSDLMTMIEIENLIEEFGETFRGDERTDGDDTIDQLKALAKELGSKVRLVGKQPNLGSSNRFKTLNQKNRGKLTPG